MGVVAIVAVVSFAVVAIVAAAITTASVVIAITTAGVVVAVTIVVVITIVVAIAIVVSIIAITITIEVVGFGNRWRIVLGLDGHVGRDGICGNSSPIKVGIVKVVLPIVGHGIVDYLVDGSLR